MHLVSYKENADVRRVLDAQGVKKSMLTEFFKANQEFSWAQSLLYREFPESAVWNPTSKKWKLRQRSKQVGQTDHLSTSCRGEAILSKSVTKPRARSYFI